MAISQKKYIDINSSIIQAAIGERDLSGLVISVGSPNTGADATLKTAYNNGDIISFDASSYKAFFPASSQEYKFAQTYFSFVSPSGRSPRRLNFMKFGITDLTETPDTAVEHALAQSSNFGSFTFLGDDETLSQANLKTAYTTNAGRNFMLLAVHGDAYISGDESENVAHATYFGSIPMCYFSVGNTQEEGAAVPMAIAASIRYDRTNSATNFMYKIFPGIVPTVTTDAVKTSFDAAHMNYIGQTQVNGDMISFHQNGFNLDGTDAAVAFNEVWLKSSIATNFFNYVTNVDRIPANYVGEGIIENAIIMPTITQGITNGVIMPGKDLTLQQEAIIYQYTGDADAASKIETDGYWLSVKIELGQDNSTYVGTYRLAYSKGDSIRFIDGQHRLV